MDDSGQIHMIEVISFAAILFISVFFVHNFDVSNNPDVTQVESLKELGYGALYSLDSIDCEGYNSLLAKYIITNNTESFTSYINNSFLPTLITYNIYVLNGTSNELSLWYPNEKKVTTDTVFRCNRIIVHERFIYDVVMEVWYL